MEESFAAEQIKLPFVSSEDRGSVRHGGEAEHLLGPNWSRLLLMASCGCLFTSHLFSALCFPAAKTRDTHFKILYFHNSLSFSGYLPTSLFFVQKE